MKQIILILIFLSLYWGALGQNYTISGHIKDQKTGEELIGAAIYVEELKTGTITNVYGFYSITLPKGNYTLNFSYMGYSPKKEALALGANKKLEILLAEDEEMLEAVEILGEKQDANVKSVEMSTNKLDIKSIKKVPALMGEVDVLKTLQLLPGVQGSEGSTGFYVRGGNTDQNLILLDEATVYNASHLGGLFSVFNPDVVKDVKLYKGGIPAEYGGRLASVLDVRMKDGNSNNFGVQGGIGSVSSRLTIEGPIQKDKSSFVVAGRRTYADIFLPLSKQEMAKESKAYFYDVNAKINHRFNDNNRLFLSGYFGNDVFEFGDLFSMRYGNATGTIRWNHLFNPKIFTNTTLIFSKFDYALGINEGITDMEWISHIYDYRLSHDYSWYPNPDHTVKWGGTATLHRFHPGFIDSKNGYFEDLELDQTQTLDYGVFVQNEQKLGDKLSIQYGLRLSAFQNIGQDTIYVYDRSDPQEWQTTDTTTYGKKDFYNTYVGLEPRLGIRYQLTDNSSLKASYQHTYQYIHLASNTMTPTPLDVWFPSNPNIKPQASDQIALGYFQNFMDNWLEFSVEVYYKWMDNVIDFRDHSDIFLNNQLASEIRVGTGYSYGAEFLLRKNVGDLTGWVSYTWSKTRRNIPDVNNGKEYPAPYDRPHDISAVLSYDFSKRISASATWVFASGMPRTVPSGRFDYGGENAPTYTARNAYRMENYHRMDIGLTIEGRERKSFENSVTISVYNVYNRHNTHSLLYSSDPMQAGNITIEKMYLFTVIPSVTWNFSF